MSSWARGRAFWRPALLRFEDEKLQRTLTRMDQKENEGNTIGIVKTF